MYVCRVYAVREHSRISEQSERERDHLTRDNTAAALEDVGSPPAAQGDDWLEDNFVSTIDPPRDKSRRQLSEGWRE